MEVQTARGSLENRSSFKRTIRDIKTEVPTRRYAAEFTDLKRQGNNLIGLCPIHEEKTPSFFIYPDGHFYCFGCKHHGDVIDLCELVEKHIDTWTAVCSLAQRFDIELSRRRGNWYRYQDEKGRIRSAVIKHLTRRYQLKLTKLYSPLVLVGSETEEEKMAELEELGRALYPISRSLAQGRVCGG